jgi:hypothetical protein
MYVFWAEPFDYRALAAGVQVASRRAASPHCEYSAGAAHGAALRRGRGRSVFEGPAQEHAWACKTTSFISQPLQ